MTPKIICPALRPAVAGLARRAPLATLPLLGSSPIGHQLATLYAAGVRDVEILAADRSEFIRTHVGSGEAWGLRASVLPVSEEPRLKDATVLDADGTECAGAFQNYRGWFETVRRAFSSTASFRAGMRDLGPEVRIHSRADVSPDARLIAPCWIGANTRIGSGCTIGPGAYIEDDCVIEKDATIEESWIGPATYVGPSVDIVESLAWGRWLCKWPTSSTTLVADPFLLGEIPAPVPNRKGRLPIRALALLTAAATLFIPLLALLIALIRRRPAWQAHQAVMPDGTISEYSDLPAFDGPLRRWPRLLAIARGDFAWVGNPPLAPAEAGALLTQYERLWYSVRPGLFSIADVHGDPQARDEDAVAHAAFFVANQTVSSKIKIFYHAARKAALATFRHGNCTSGPRNEDILRGPHPSRHGFE